MEKNRLNFLFVIPRITLGTDEGYSLPLGIPYVYSYQKRAGLNVFALNLNSYQEPVSQCLEKAIRENDIDVIATGGLSQMYHLILDVIAAAKRYKPEIITIVGGGIISSDPETAMEALETVDFGVIGEGEETMYELAQTLECGSMDFQQIAGLIYKKNEDYIITDRRPDIENLDLLPFPDYGAFDIGRVIELSSRDGRGGANYDSAVAVIGSRSCPFKCTFCFHTSGRKYRQRSLDNLFAEIDHLVSHYDVREILLSDELFAADIDRVREFSRRISEYNLPWTCTFRVDQISKELVSCLKESNIKMVGVGLESYDDRILKSMRKGINSKQIDNALRLLYDEGIPVSGQFILGDQEETLETATNTLNYCRDNLHYHINLSFIRPFPGTHIYKEAIKNGIIADRVKYLKDGCPQVNISKLSNEEFSNVLHQMDVMYQEESFEIKDIKISSTDVSSGCIDFAGTCEKCGYQHTWSNVSICSNGFLYCPSCTQKFNIPMIDEIFTKLDNNIAKLADRYGKVAIWAVTNYISNYISSSLLQKDPRLFLIDTAECRQQLTISGKKVFAPEILDREKISSVIIGAAAQAGLIGSIIRNIYPSVSNITVLSNLIGD